MKIQFKNDYNLDDRVSASILLAKFNEHDLGQGYTAKWIDGLVYITKDGEYKDKAMTWDTFYYFFLQGKEVEVEDDTEE